MALKRGDEMRHFTKTVTFDGTAGNGATGTVNVATITGQVMIVSETNWCTSSLTSGGAATLELGTTTDTDLFVVQTTATTIDADEFWLTATPAASLALDAKQKEVALSEDIILTVGTAGITGGEIEFDFYWMPLRPTGFLVPA